MQAKTAVADLTRRQRKLSQALKHLVTGLIDVLEIKVDDDLLELRYVVLATRLRASLENSDAVVDAAARLVFALGEQFCTRAARLVICIEKFVRNSFGAGVGERAHVAQRHGSLRHKNTAGIRAGSPVASKRQFVVHLRCQRGVGLGCAVLRRASDDGKYRRADPPDALVSVVEAANL